MNNFIDIKDLNLEYKIFTTKFDEVSKAIESEPVNFGKTTNKTGVFCAK